MTIVGRSGGVYVLTLIVKEASIADSGLYTCLALNEFGQAKANLKLDLSQGPPHRAHASYFIFLLESVLSCVVDASRFVGPLFLFLFFF